MRPWRGKSLAAGRGRCCCARRERWGEGREGRRRMEDRRWRIEYGERRAGAPTL